MSWSRELQNMGCTSSSLPSLWALLCTALLLLQTYHHTYKTSPPNCFETRVAMMPADQTDEACKSNINRDLGGVQFMSMFTTQAFADCRRAVECHLTYLVFCIAKEPSSVYWPIRCFALRASRQAPKGRKVRLAYLVARTACKQAVEYQRVEESVWPIR